MDSTLAHVIGSGNTVYLRASDGTNTGAASITLTIRDAVAPTIASVSGTTVNL